MTLAYYLMHLFFFLNYVTPLNIREAGRKLLCSQELLHLSLTRVLVS